MARVTFEEERFNAPIPGESMTVEPGKFPFDRPPETTNPEEAVAILFKSMSRPKSVNKILDALDNDVPMDSIANVLAQSMFGEGVIPPQIIPHVILSTIAILEVMAEQAGISPKMSTDFAIDESQDITPEDIERGEDIITAAVEQFQEEAPSEEAGLMQRPEEV